jgi:hypothetical protein
MNMLLRLVYEYLKAYLLQRSLILQTANYSQQNLTTFKTRVFAWEKCEEDAGSIR